MADDQVIAEGAELSDAEGLSRVQDKLDEIAVSNPELAKACSQLSDIAESQVIVVNHQSKVRLMNEVVNPLLADDSKSVADLQAAVASWKE